MDPQQRARLLDMRDKERIVRDVDWRLGMQHRWVDYSIECGRSIFPNRLWFHGPSPPDISRNHLNPSNLSLIRS